MSYVDSIKEIAVYSFSWLKGNSIWKLYGALALAYFFLNIFTPDYFSTLFESEVPDITMAVFVALILIVATLATIYFSYVLLYEVFSTKFAKLKKLSLSTIFGLFVIQVLSVLAALFSVYELKWLTLLGAAIVLAVGAFLSGGYNVYITAVLSGLAALAFLIYSVVALRNGVRLFQASGLYLQGSGFQESLKQSWVKTSGKALKIFGMAVVSIVVAGVIAFVETALGLAAAFGDLIWDFLGVPLTPFSAFISAVLGPATVVVSTFFYVGIYCWLEGKKVKTK